MCRPQSRKNFNTEVKGRTTEGHGVRVQGASARSAICYSTPWASVVLPFTSVLKTLRTSHLHGRRDIRARAKRSECAPRQFKRLLSSGGEVLAFLCEICRWCAAINCTGKARRPLRRLCSVRSKIQPSCPPEHLQTCLPSGCSTHRVHALKAREILLVICNNHALMHHGDGTDDHVKSAARSSCRLGFRHQARPNKACPIIEG